MGEAKQGVFLLRVELQASTLTRSVGPRDEPELEQWACFEVPPLNCR
jgi:hypothetical protein